MSTSEPRSQLIEELNQAVQRSGNLTVLFTHAISEQLGLSATEFELLDFLRNGGPKTAGQLAKACGISTGGITGLVDRLEKAGFVKRVPDALDRRRVIVELVPHPEIGRQVRSLYEPVQQGFIEAVSHYSDDDIAIILDFINRTSNMIETVRANFRP